MDLLKLMEREEIERLRQQIKYHDELYYVHNRPEISDYEYDQLVARLKELESRNPELIVADSPTQRLGDRPTERLDKYEHRHPMLSLDNTYSYEQLREWNERCAKLAAGQPYTFVTELKIDGVSIAVIYIDGWLSRAVTRGDGTVGDVVTENVKAIETVPQRLLVMPPGVREVEVRGEIYMPNSVFARLNEEKRFANPRNTTAGTIKVLNPRLVAERGLRCFFYDLYFDGKKPFASHWQALEWLREANFAVNEHSRRCEDLAQVIQFCELWRIGRHKLDYEIDGVVIKINETLLQEDFGMTSKSPRWAIAYKYPPEQAVTRVRAITVQVGRTGALTPVARLDPVELAGTTITRASLHNKDWIERLGLKVGDWVVVEKSGEIIPQVVRVLIERRSEVASELSDFVMPASCPVCGQPVVRLPEEVVTRCVNSSCPAKLKNAILQYASRSGMQIEGLGEELVSQLIARALVKDVADLYGLTVRQLVMLDRVGRRSAEKLVEQISESKGKGLDRLLYALGIPYVGEQKARLLAEHFRSMDALMQADIAALSEVEEIGDVASRHIYEWFRNRRNVDLIERLKAAGVQMEYKVSRRGKAFADKVFVFTGRLKSMSREEAKRAVESRGGKVSSAVSKKTDYLIVGADAGTKLDEARKLLLKVLDEEDFLAMLRASEISESSEN